MVCYLNGLNHFPLDVTLCRILNYIICYPVVQVSSTVVRVFDVDILNFTLSFSVVRRNLVIIANRFAQWNVNEILQLSTMAISLDSNSQLDRTATIALHICCVHSWWLRKMI